MESFFVPVYIKLGNFSDDKLLVALIMVTPEKIWVRYSQKRIHIAGQLVNPASESLAKEVLEQIKSKADEVNVSLADKDNVNIQNNHIFNKDYFEYLKKYSQNTLLFGNVEKIGPSMDFESLFASLMNDENEAKDIVKQTEKEDFLKYLLSFPQMNDEDYHFIQEKRKHFRKWRDLP